MWYWLYRPFVIIIMRLCFKLKVDGAENIPEKTNFIVVANHTSFLDPFIIGAAIPQRIFWIAGQELYRPFFVRWFMRSTETLPVGRGASEKLLYLIKRNKNVGIFPEGARSRDGKLREFRKGASILALKTGRPVVPCAITGAYEAYPPKAKFPKFLPVKIKIGKPKYFLKEFEEVIDDIFLQNGIFIMKTRIEEMLNDG